MTKNFDDTRNKWKILFTAVVMTFMTTLDTSIVNVALPVMQKTLGADMRSIEWVSSIYLIVTCATLLIFGRVGDVYGKVRVFKLGTLTFSLSSILCSISCSLPLLIVARILQALGCAAALATDQGIITETFPPEERGKALGIVATFVALGSLAGPTLGGLILTVLPWQFIFLINVPIGLISLVIGQKTLPRDKKGPVGRMDGKGTILMGASITLIFISVTLLQYGISAGTFFMLAGGILLLALFFLVERRAPEPLIPLKMLGNKMFTINLVTMFCIFIAIGAHNIILPFYLQDALALSPGIAGLLLTVTPVIIAVVGPISGSLSDKIGCELPSMLGLFVHIAGLLSFLLLTVSTPYWALVLFLTLIAIGAGLFQSPNNSLVMGSVPQNELGFAGSIAALMRYMGMSVGVTLSTTLLYNRMSAKAGYPVSDYVSGRPDIFLYGMHWVYGVLALVVMLGAAFAVLRFIRTKKRNGQTELPFEKNAK